MVTMSENILVPIEPSHVRRAMPPGARFSVETMADGWRLRRFDWPGASPSRGSILFEVGRGDMIEKYFEAFAHWHNAGWQISAFDWRGQGGSGRLLANPMIGHIDDFTIWERDLEAFYARWRAQTPAPHIVIGHSMGGHLLLRALVERRIAPDGAVLIAPMLGFETPLHLPVAVAGAIVKLAAKFWPERLAWPENESPTRANASRQAFLTHDPGRYADETWWREQQPELALGPPSLGWLGAAHRSTQQSAEPGGLESVTTPLLIIGTDGDQLVSPRAIRTFAARLPHARLHMFDKEVAHEILREADGPRDAALAMIDAFLDEVQPRA